MIKRNQLVVEVVERFCDEKMNDLDIEDWV
jgi:hypothetical protein